MVFNFTDVTSGKFVTGTETEIETETVVLATHDAPLSGKSWICHCTVFTY